MSKVELNLTANAIKVLERRYLRKNTKGQLLETPEEMFRRVAKNIASAELILNPEAQVEVWEEKFYNMMADLDFLPNSPTLMNAGSELQQLSACFVLPVEDSMESIFEAIKQTAIIHKSGGGTGFSFSRIRPKNDVVQSTKGVSSGPLSFMSVFDAATEAIKQGGTRRGANMGILRIDHPDILDFINAKKGSGKFSNFNLSVALTDSFMQAFEEDKEFPLVNPRTKNVVNYLNAREVFDQIVQIAWETGDPGVIFLDKLNRDNPTPQLGEIESTNPCGEQPLLPFESCNLGSINLAKIIKNKQIDWDKLQNIVTTGVRFLDNVIEVNKYPLPVIEEMTKGNRKIGLGVMGFADLLMQLGLPYDSEKALEVAEEIMDFIQRESKRASGELAKERGTFPNIKGSIYDKPGGNKLRNATTTTIAPTGTISIIANCSSGIEPVFAITYVRKVMDNDELLEVNPYFERVMRERGLYDEKLMKVIYQQGSLKNIGEIPPDIREIFVTSHDISPKWHVLMQAAFQKHTDNAVSKTINFPNEAIAEDIRNAFLLAYEEGCKGITIYRDGSKENQVLNKGETLKKGKREKIIPRPRPTKTLGFTEMAKIGCGKLYVTVNADEEGACEVFTSTGRTGGCPSQSEATGRLISLALRSGVDVEAITRQLKGIRCLSTIRRDNGIKVLSCPDAIGRTLEAFSKQLSENGGLPVWQKDETTFEVTHLTSSLLCPDCQGTIELEGGCVVCRNCGYSKCG
ncbi:MAG: vitamin B12-dependent ribonucleotide reductase [Candidatus Tectomicrobia bacterium]|uniref:Vitamin B12-dependent ribonucleotide reductase n=1 Tax=Tectimicrobiota bacterium TaxID=2528274 RepID=A0A933GND4_UNCTE|nr:vitamin B12-dependent ribonucleotide reductase [Candidatus Tectomicrobia bacterium]